MAREQELIENEDKGKRQGIGGEWTRRRTSLAETYDKR